MLKDDTVAEEDAEERENVVVMPIIGDMWI
jgi:hypothetical protein